MRFCESYQVFDDDREGKRRNSALLRAAIRYAEALRLNKAFGI